VPFTIRYLVPDNLFVVALKDNLVLLFLKVAIAGVSEELRFAGYGTPILGATSINFSDLSFISSALLPFRCKIPKCSCMINNIAYARTLNGIPTDLILFAYLDTPNETKAALPGDDVRLVFENALTLGDAISGLMDVHERRDLEQELREVWEAEKEEALEKLRAEIKAQADLLRQQDMTMKEQALQIEGLTNTLKDMAAKRKR
jgi:hypothetical protein